MREELKEIWKLFRLQYTINDDCTLTNAELWGMFIVEINRNLEEIKKQEPL